MKLTPPSLHFMEIEQANSDTALSVQVIKPKIKGRPTPQMMAVIIEGEDGSAHAAVFTKRQAEELVEIIKMAARRLRK